MRAAMVSAVFFGGGGHQDLVPDHGGEGLAEGHAVADPGEDVGA